MLKRSYFGLALLWQSFTARLQCQAHMAKLAALPLTFSSFEIPEPARTCHLHVAEEKGFYFWDGPGGTLICYSASYTIPFVCVCACVCVGVCGSLLGGFLVDNACMALALLL